MEQNAQIQLGLFGKMIGFWVKDITELIIDDIVSHLTIAQMNEIIGGEMRMKYNTFLIKEKSENGIKRKKRIEFTDEIMGEFDLERKQIEMMKKESDNTRLVLVNPYQFARMRWLTVADAEAKVGRSEFSQKVLDLEAYDRMIQNGYVDQQAVTRDFLVDTFAKGETEKYMAKEPQIPPEATAPDAGSPEPVNPLEVTNA
jgi:hypothetical protein